MVSTARTISRRDDLHAAAPPFRRNPSSWRQRVPIAGLALVATAISAYMALYQWGVIGSVWEPLFGGGTRAVLGSAPARTMHRWFGIPDAAMGAFAYLGDAVFGLAGSTRRWQYRPWLVLVFGLDVIPAGVVSIVLVVLQGTMVGAWCTLCLVTAAISLALIVLAYDEVWSTLAYLYRVWRRSRDPAVVWRVFCGDYDPVGSQVALERSHD